MHPTSAQSQLFSQLLLPASSVLVNDRVSVQTEGDQRVIYVQGVIFAHYSREDRCAEAYALVKLYESRYADQNDLARCFGYSTRTLRRYQQRLESGGLSALVRPGGRPAGGSAGSAPLSERHRTILRLKTQDMSNRWIGARLGLSETAVRKILQRLGWKAPSQLTPALSRKRMCPHPQARLLTALRIPITMPSRYRARRCAKRSQDASLKKGPRKVSIATRWTAPWTVSWRL